jgi:uncharacterized peroxidase-related enzyme
MTYQLAIQTAESAPEGSRETLRQVGQTYGFVPNLLGGLANSPAALHAYLGLAEQFAKSTLSPAEQQVVSLSVSAENRCGYCVAAHSVLARKALTPTQIAALRDGSSLGDSRLDALAAFTRAVVAQRAWLQNGELAAFEQAGFSRSQALDVLVGVTQKTLSNYSNHLIDTPVDAAFEAARWTPAVRRST